MSFGPFLGPTLVRDSSSVSWGRALFVCCTNAGAFRKMGRTIPRTKLTQTTTNEPPSARPPTPFFPQTGPTRRPSRGDNKAIAQCLRAAHHRTPYTRALRPAAVVKTNALVTFVGAPLVAMSLCSCCFFLLLSCIFLGGAQPNSGQKHKGSANRTCEVAHGDTYAWLEWLLALYGENFCLCVDPSLPLWERGGGGF